MSNAPKTVIVGVDAETKTGERRCPFTPYSLSMLLSLTGCCVRVKTSKTRIFTDEDFAAYGIEIVEDLLGCDIIFKLKELSVEEIIHNGRGVVYLLFSHTIKGQSHNMKMLRTLMEMGCTLIDYEKITNEKGKRLVLFSWQAGVAGMIATLRLIGLRTAWLEGASAFTDVLMPQDYRSIEMAREEVRQAGEKMHTTLPIPESMAPFVVGFTGYGNVAQGAWSIFDVLPHEVVEPHELLALRHRRNPPRDRLFKVVFREENMAEPRDRSLFDLPQYFAHPELYRGIFEARYAPLLDALVNCVFWTKKYPRLITDAGLRHQKECNWLRWVAIADISCDLCGSVESTKRETTLQKPFMTFDPTSGHIQDGYQGTGVVPMMTVGNLPTSLPQESSEAFAKMLEPFTQGIVQTDFTQSFPQTTLPPEIQRAMILHQGEFTPNYRYVEAFLT